MWQKTPGRHGPVHEMPRQQFPCRPGSTAPGRVLAGWEPSHADRLDREHDGPRQPFGIIGRRTARQRALVAPASSQLTAAAEMERQGTVTTPCERTLAAAVGQAFPGWRAWRQPDGVLAACRGGSPPAGAHARGATPGELLDAIKAGRAPAPDLRPPEATALAALSAAAGPRTARQVSDASGLAASTAGKVLASLHARGLVARRRGPRGSWHYIPVTGAATSGQASGQAADG